MCAYGPNVLGYNDPDVDAAAIEQLKKGNCMTSPSYKMVEFAELMVDTVNCADWAFFAKNGTYLIRMFSTVLFIKSISFII